MQTDSTALVGLVSRDYDLGCAGEQNTAAPGFCREKNGILHSPGAGVAFFAFYAGEPAKETCRSPMPQ
jgi:hypothetical protein